MEANSYLQAYKSFECSFCCYKHIFFSIFKSANTLSNSDCCNFIKVSSKYPFLLNRSFNCLKSVLYCYYYRLLLLIKLLFAYKTLLFSILLLLLIMLNYSNSFFKFFIILSLFCIY